MPAGKLDSMQKLEAPLSWGRHSSKFRVQLEGPTMPPWAVSVVPASRYKADNCHSRRVPGQCMTSGCGQLRGDQMDSFWNPRLAADSQLADGQMYQTVDRQL